MITMFDIERHGYACVSDVQLICNNTQFPPDINPKGGLESTVQKVKAEFERLHRGVAMDNITQDFNAV